MSKHPDSIPIFNTRGVNDWMHGDNEPQSFAKTHFLLTDNRETFTRLWGPRHRGLRAEFHHWIWDVYFEGHHFVIFTATGKGTSYEYAGNAQGHLPSYEEQQAPVYRDLFIRFLEHLVPQLCNPESIEAWLTQHNIPH